jgi:hypothetical protein
MWGGDRELPPGPASQIGFNGISDMPRPNLRRSLTDLTNSSGPRGPSDLPSALSIASPTPSPTATPTSIRGWIYATSSLGSPVIIVQVRSHSPELAFPFHAELTSTSGPGSK